jgi:hypothetical protein
MNFWILNLNLTRDKIKKEFLFKILSTGRNPRSRPTCIVRLACLGPVVKASWRSLPWPEQHWVGPRSAHRAHTPPWRKHMKSTQRGTACNGSPAIERRQGAHQE